MNFDPFSPVEHPLFVSLNEFIQSFSRQDNIDMERLTLNLSKFNKVLERDRFNWISLFGKEIEDFVETLAYHVLSQVILLLRLDHSMFASEVALYPETSKPQRRRPNFPRQISEQLKQWIDQHPDNPYPSREEKDRLCERLGISLKQLNDWFINARRRKS